MRTQDRNSGWFTCPDRAHEGATDNIKPARADDCVRDEYVLHVFFATFMTDFQTLCSFPSIAETSPVSFQTTPADTVTQRVETVGRVRPHVGAKIVDTAGNVVPVNTPGELLVSGYLVQKGYVVQSDI
jgi:acyl-CoA synthetase (AMP-forming)/AMP-acid ligase II